MVLISNIINKPMQAEQPTRSVKNLAQNLDSLIFLVYTYNCIIIYTIKENDHEKNLST